MTVRTPWLLAIAALPSCAQIAGTDETPKTRTAIASFEAHPDRVFAGRPTTVSWTTRSMTSCMLDGTPVPPNGETLVVPTGAPLRLSCIGEEGAVERTIEVSVARATDLRVGGQSTCVLLGGPPSRMKCFGRNDRAQLAVGDIDPRGYAAGQMGDALPDSLLGAPVRSVAIGGFHACSVTPNGALRCWGAGGFTGLGDVVMHGGRMDDLQPNRLVVPLSTEVAEVGCGEVHTCARLIDGRVTCWGRNDYGQLGLGLDPSAHTGVRPGEIASAGFVPLGGRAVALAVGQYASCAIVEGESAVACWGYNGRGQLGARADHNPGSAESPAPSRVQFDTRVLAVTVGGQHMCALLEGGVVHCLGNASMVAFIGPLALPTPAIQVTSGDGHACVLSKEGVVRCWGSNTSGVLGLGDTKERTTKSLFDAPVDLGARAVRLSAGPSHTCAVLENGGVKCWGNNEHGQLGLGDREHRGDQPDEMGENLPFVDVGP